MSGPARHRRTARVGLVGVVGLLAVLLTGCTPLLALLADEVAEPPSTNFVDYGGQTLNWGSCLGEGNEVECASVYAPLDWAAADEGTADREDDIQLRLVRHRAEGGDPVGTLFVNPGGPGASGVDYVQAAYDRAVQPAVREKFDVVGWDPRGVGQSSAVTCLDDEGLDEFLYGTGDPEEDGAFLEFGSDAWIEMGIESSAEFGEACLAETGDLLGHVDTLSTVRDLDMLREIVGDESLNYLGYSYGTRIGALYADEFPDRVGRLVLDGAIDPTVGIVEASRVQAVGFEAALRDYVADCLARSGCPLASAGNVEAAVTGIDRLLGQVEESPIRASDGRMLYDSTLFTSIVATLYSPDLWGHLDQILAEVSLRNPEHAFVLADYYNDRVDGVYQTNLMEAFFAINCLDYPREGEDFEAMRVEAEKTIEAAPISGRFQSFGEISCARWPVPAVDIAHAVTGAGADPLLVVGTTGDPATPMRWAESLAEQLESATLVTFHGDGHTAYGKSECVDAIVDAYFLTGAVPSGVGAVCR